MTLHFSLDSVAQSRSTADFQPDNASAPTLSTPPEAAPSAREETKIALLTGASSGIGAALARRLAADRGYRLLLSGRDRGRLSDIASTTGGTVLPADLSSVGGGERLAQSALGTAGRVDLLIAAAGVGWCGHFEEMPMPAVDRVLIVDLIAVIHLVRLLLPHMIARGSGVIALFGSVAGCAAVRDEAVYSAAKAGLAAFAESLRQELRGTGVQITHIVPGVVETPFFERRGTPYLRTYPRPVPATRVADATLRAIERGRNEVYIPRWMELPGRVRGLAPGLYRMLAARFG